MKTRSIPVNAPTAASAVIALKNELRRRGIAVLAEPVAFPAPRNLPDDQVALTVTKPKGERTTILVQVDTDR